MKRILSSIAALFILGTAAAQNWDFGVKAGLNFSGVSNWGIQFTPNLRTSVYLGGFVQYHINERFGIQPEIVYSIQGTKGTDPNNQKFILNYQYLNIPLMWRYHITRFLSLDAGPQFGFKLKAEGELKNKGVSQKVEMDVPAMDFAIAMGTTVKVWSNIDVSVRYNYGVIDTDSKNQGDWRKMRNQVLQIGAAYRF